MKEHCYQFLRDLSDAGEVLKSATERIGEFIAHLKRHDADFSRITKDMMLTKYPFIEAIRVEIKNNIFKVNKENLKKEANQSPEVAEEPEAADDDKQDVEESGKEGSDN